MIHDRTSYIKQHNFTLDQIVGTLNRYLLTKPSYNNWYNSLSTYSNPYAIKKRHVDINAISTDDLSIDLDEDILHAMLNALERRPQLLDKDCLICRTTNPDDADHKFNACPILNNHELLKTAYIKGCIAARQALDLQKASHSNKLKAINNIQLISDSSSQDDSSPKNIAISQIMSTIEEGVKQDFH